MTSLSIATTLSCSKEEVITQTSAFTPPGCVIKKVKVITHRFNEATGHEIKHICPIFPKNITRITTKQELMLAVQEEFKSLKERMERGATTISEDLLDFINAIERPDGYWLLTKKKTRSKSRGFYRTKDCRDKSAPRSRIAYPRGSKTFAYIP